MLNLLMIPVLDLIGGAAPIYTRVHQGHILTAGFGILLLDLVSLSMMLGKVFGSGGGRQGPDPLPTLERICPPASEEPKLSRRLPGNSSISVEPASIFSCAWVLLPGEISGSKKRSPQKKITVSP
jgi:hypothetical protein